MFWLATQMWLLLLTAFALGLGLGWSLWGNHRTLSPAVASGEEGTLASEDDASEPQRYSEPSQGARDDLTQIIGIDAGAAEKLNEAGIFYLTQIAEWGPSQASWIEDRLATPGRIHNERWIEQAQSLGEG